MTIVPIGDFLRGKKFAVFDNLCILWTHFYTAVKAAVECETGANAL